MTINRGDSSLVLFAKGYNCAQSTLTVFGERYGLSSETCLRIASCFGGGIANMGATCGAVSGALMAIGLRFGSVDPQDNAARIAKYAATQEYLDEFRALHGSLTCCDLLGCDLSTSEGMQYAREEGLFGSVCPALVQSSVEIVERIINRQ